MEEYKLKKGECIALTVADVNLYEGGVEKAYEVLKYRLSNNIWGVNSNTNYRYYMKKGTNLVFYVSGTKQNSQCFIGEAKISSVTERFPSFDVGRYMKEGEWLLPLPYYKLELTNTKFFKKPISIYDVKDKMNLFKKKKKTNKWGAFIQGGAFKLDKHDYTLIKQYK